VAVKIRLKRMGKIRAPYYRIVVADSRTKRDGRVIEEIGKYHPTEEPSFIEVQSDRAQYWLGVGAQPSPQVEAILKLTGDWGIFKGDKNAVSTVKTKQAKVEFQADEKKKPVLKPKSEKPAVAPEPAAAPPVAESAAEADAAADQVRAEEADESTTTTLETPEQVDNSAAPAAAAAEPEATDAEAVAEAEPVVESEAPTPAEVEAPAEAELEQPVAEVVAEAEAAADAEIPTEA
jgi:small subunit ribosomal protein S16